MIGPTGAPSCFDFEREFGTEPRLRTFFWKAWTRALVAREVPIAMATVLSKDGGGMAPADRLFRPGCSDSFWARKFVVGCEGLTGAALCLSAAPRIQRQRLPSGSERDGESLEQTGRMTQYG